MSDPAPATGTLPPHLTPGPTRSSSWLAWLFLASDRRLRAGWRVALLLAGMLLALAVASGILMAGLAIHLGYRPKDSADLLRLLFDRFPYWPLLIDVVALPFLVLLVWCFRRFLDRRSWRSLGFELGPAPLREAGVGLALGAAAILLSIAPLLLSGAVESAQAGGSGVPGTSGPTDLSIVLGCLVAAAFVEELVARAYILTNLREALGSVAAVLISAAIFAGLHVGNPSASVLSTANILLAGMLLGGVFVVTGRLWMPWTLHVAWNACQGMLLGLPVSGVAIPSLFRLRLVGSDLTTGGAFGLEGSLWNTVALGAMLCLIALAGARQPDAGAWRRRAIDGSVVEGAEGSQRTGSET